ncbi:hypothetical protein D9M70_449690 [compost metagenome]
MDRGIGAGEVKQADLGSAEGQGRRIGKRRVYAELARCGDHIVEPDLLGKRHRWRIQRAGKGLGKRDPAAIAATGILGRPAVNVDRRIQDLVGQSEPGLQGRIVDEQLEGGTRLPHGGHCAIELALLIVATADHGDDRSVGRHRNQRRLGYSGRLSFRIQRVCQNPFGDPLQLWGQCRAHRGRTRRRAGDFARLRRDPVGEPASGAWRRRRRMERGEARLDLCSLGCGDLAIGYHRVEDDRCALARTLKIVDRIPLARRPQQASQHRRFR